MSVNDCIRMEIESGNCNVCSAPCLSCMHYSHSFSVMGSNSESGCSGNICTRGEANSFFMVDVKSGICDVAETSNILSFSSSHDSFSENAESKSTVRASAACDLSDYVDMSQKKHSSEVAEEEKKIDKVHIRSDSRLLSHIISKDPNGLECHGDNISFITEAIDPNVVCHRIVDLEMKDVGSSNVFSNCLSMRESETEETHCTFRRSNATVDASLAKTSNLDSITAYSSKHSHLTLPERDVPSKNVSLFSEDRSSSFDKSGLIAEQGNFNWQLQDEIAKYAETGNVEDAGTEKIPGVHPKNDISRGSRKRNSFSSDNSMVDNLSHEKKIKADCEVPSDNGSRNGHVNDLMEKDSALLELDIKNSHGDLLLPRAANEGENSESDSVLDDVKVCDICGDAGREDLLAICSCCTDGAEHTYCMRKMLDKVPEGDWLCEECKMKELENENLNDSDHVSGRLKPTCLSEKNQNSLSNLTWKQLSKLNDGVTDLEKQGFAKGLYSHKISSTRPADRLEGKKASEPSRPSRDAASPRKKPPLSRESSFKNKDMDAVKNVSMVSFEAPSVNGSRILSRSQTFSRTQTSFSDRSVKGQSKLQSAHGCLSRSVSFSNSITKPKVKQLIEDVPFKKKTGSEAVITNPRNEGLKSMTKSTSFKNLGSGFSHTQAASKIQLLQSIHLDSPKGSKEVNGRNILEKKNSFATDSSIVNPFVAPDSKYPLKVNSISILNEGKVNGVPKSSFNSINNGSDEVYDLGGNRKRISCPSKPIGSSNGKSNLNNNKLHQTPKDVMQTAFSASNGSCSKVDMASQCVAFQLSESGFKDRMTDSTSSIISRPSSSVNQHSLAEKQRESTHKFSAELGSSGIMKNKSRCIDEVDAAKPMIKGKGNKVDITEELPAVRTHMICESAPQNSSKTLCMRNISSVVDHKNDQDILKLFTVDSRKIVAKRDSELLAVQPLDAFFVPKSEGLHEFLVGNELNVKSFPDALPSEAPLLKNPFRASAIPKLECLWQGSFDVLRSGSYPELFDGIQAHLSSYACDRVIEVSNKIPRKIELEEMSHAISWPLQSQGIGPKEGNIALFFFAKDIECYDKSYNKLMDRMLRNDLSLKGNIDGTELLVFTSKRLPVNSQRWNRLYYLWGMFVGNQRDNLSAIDHQKKHFESNLRMAIASDSIVQNSDNIVTSKPLTESDKSSKLKPDEITTSVDLQVMTSDSEDKVFGTQDASHVLNSGKRVVADLNVPLDSPSFLVNDSALTTADQPDVIDAPELQHEIPNVQSCFEVKHDRTCQDKFINNGINRRTSESFAHTTDVPVKASLSEASSVPSNRNQGEECCNNEGCKSKRVSSEPDIVITNDLDSTGNAESRLTISRLSSGKLPTNTTEATPWRERESWMPTDHERERKKTCYSNGKGLGNIDLSSKLSSKIHPLYPTISSHHQQGRSICLESAKPEVSRSVDDFFLPSNKDDIPILILSSDDEDNPDPNTPDLELGLGGMSKSTMPVALYSLFPSVESSNQNKQSGPSRDNGDDISATSLTLSLGFPPSDDKKSAKSFMKTEQVLPERRPVNKSLFLFGGPLTAERNS